jgi:GH25 family lysozyme M1 (1,4-beta-N-acetylmuramidase)
MTKILDLSHHQIPEKINYDKLAKEVDLVIIRTQYGSEIIDRYYKTHHKEFKKRGVPTNAYAWLRGSNIEDMEKEAVNFYNRTKDLKPEIWWLDVEERSMNDMRAGVSAYVNTLRSLGVKKIGIYIAHHLYKSFNLNLEEVDAVWIPRYGKNDGHPDEKPDFPCDLWQYTSQGKLSGYDGPLDVSKLNGNKPLDWFTGKEKPKAAAPKYPGKTIKNGSRGKNVEKIQKKAGAKVDGLFGPKTEAAVKSYQKKHDLVADGVVGPKSWKKMF